MTSSVHRVLGKERIKKICNDCGLTVEDQKIIDEILEEWEHLVGQVEKKVAMVLEKVKNNPCRLKIALAILAINLEFSSREESCGFQNN